MFGMNPNTVLYDDECSFCTFQMKLLSWLDWGNRFTLLPASDPRVGSLAPTLTHQQLNEAIHCVLPGGEIHRGARAIRFISMRLPLLWPLAAVLWLPGVILIAERVYAFISRNRQHISRIFGCKGACALMPDRAGIGTKSGHSKP
jgi:predicted DCC family thiol-disulfide oxidoreductase YuxK